MEICGSLDTAPAAPLSANRRNSAKRATQCAPRRYARCSTPAPRAGAHELTLTAMLVFLHMHKCAGTYVVEAAQMSRFKLPARHVNGYLVNDDGSPLMWSWLTFEQISSVIEAQRKDGVEFLAIEWDFAPMAYFVRIENIKFFTVLRDPLARALSNFRYDKAYGWIERNLAFPDFIDDSGLYRANNYYVKKLSNVNCRGSVGDEHLAQAISALLSFEKVIDMDCCIVSEELKLLGISRAPDGLVNTFEARPDKDSVTKKDMLVSIGEARSFIERNAHDYALFHHFRAARPNFDLTE